MKEEIKGYDIESSLMFVALAFEKCLRLYDLKQFNVIKEFQFPNEVNLRNMTLISLEIIDKNVFIMSLSNRKSLILKINDD